MGMPTGRNSGLAEIQDSWPLSSRRDQDNHTEMALSYGGFMFLYSPGQNWGWWRLEWW